MIWAASFASPRIVDVLPTGVEPTGTSCSVSDGSDWPVVEKPAPRSSIGVDPIGVDPIGDEKKDCADGLLTVRSRSVLFGTWRYTETFVPRGSPVRFTW